MELDTNEASYCFIQPLVPNGQSNNKAFYSVSPLWTNGQTNKANVLFMVFGRFKGFLFKYIFENLHRFPS